MKSINTNSTEKSKSHSYFGLKSFSLEYIHFSYKLLDFCLTSAGLIVH